MIELENEKHFDIGQMPLYVPFIKVNFLFEILNAWLI